MYRRWVLCKVQPAEFSARWILAGRRGVSLPIKRQACPRGHLWPIVGYVFTFQLDRIPDRPQNGPYFDSGTLKRKKPDEYPLGQNEAKKSLSRWAVCISHRHFLSGVHHHKLAHALCGKPRQLKTPCCFACFSSLVLLFLWHLILQ